MNTLASLAMVCGGGYRVILSSKTKVGAELWSSWPEKQPRSASGENRQWYGRFFAQSVRLHGEREAELGRLNVNCNRFNARNDWNAENRFSLPKLLFSPPCRNTFTNKTPSVEYAPNFVVSRETSKSCGEHLFSHAVVRNNLSTSSRSVAFITSSIFFLSIPRTEYALYDFQKQY